MVKIEGITRQSMRFMGKESSGFVSKRQREITRCYKPSWARRIYCELWAPSACRAVNERTNHQTPSRGCTNHSQHFDVVVSNSVARAVTVPLSSLTLPAVLL